MQTRLPEVLQQKQKGDQWYSYLAPEEYHTWQSPWSINAFRKYNTDVLSISISGDEKIPGTENLQTFSNKKPLYLEKTGIELTQCRISTRQKISASAKFRVDSIIELNSIIAELSEISGIGFWWVQSFEISNKKTGGICQFLRHNPDGHGVSLYLYRIEIDKISKLYPNISLTDQAYYLGNFKQYYAVCECTEALQKFHGCSIDKSLRKPIN